MCNMKFIVSKEHLEKLKRQLAIANKKFLEKETKEKLKTKYKLSIYNFLSRFKVKP